MITAFTRLLAATVIPIALAACANPERAAAKQTAVAPLGVDLGGSGPVTSSASAPMQVAAIGAGDMRHASSGQMQMVHEGHNDAHATGTVNSVDPAQHKINVSHQPIPEIGWPAMTMDFAVAPAVDVRAIKPGARINFTIEKGQGGMYEIQAITPAGGR